MARPEELPYYQLFKGLVPELAGATEHLVQWEAVGLAHRADGPVLAPGRPARNHESALLYSARPKFLRDLEFG